MVKPQRAQPSGQIAKKSSSRVNKRQLVEEEPSSESESDEGSADGSEDEGSSDEEVASEDEMPNMGSDSESENNDGQESENDQEGELDELGKQRANILNSMDPAAVRARIDETLRILANLKVLKDKTTSRSELVDRITADFSDYFGYLPELAELLVTLLSPKGCLEFMESQDKARPLVIRTNTLKSTRKTLMEALTKRGATVEAVPWSKVAVKVTEASIPIGATPEYLAGHYMLQSAASLNPVMALGPKPGERVLDMASAPGGKTSYIVQLMRNSGTVVANDLKPARQKATVANLHRLGAKNCIVCCYDGRKIPAVMKGFDRVLLDAPCSGLGVISRDQSVKIQRTPKDITRMALLQKELLLAAIDCTNFRSKTGGVIVYSTCSVSNEENEQVVQYALKKRHVRLVDTGLTVGLPGMTRFRERQFHPSMALTRRFYPHVHNMDGFFVAKFVKYDHGEKVANDDDEDEEDEEDEESDEGDESDEKSGEGSDDSAGDDSGSDSDDSDGSAEVEAEGAASDDSGSDDEKGGGDDLDEDEEEDRRQAQEVMERFFKEGGELSGKNDEVYDDDDDEEDSEEEEEEEEEEEKDLTSSKPKVGSKRPVARSIAALRAFLTEKKLAQRQEKRERQEQRRADKPRESARMVGKKRRAKREEQAQRDPDERVEGVSRMYEEAAASSKSGKKASKKRRT